jgi:hypothetical protein
MSEAASLSLLRPFQGSYMPSAPPHYERHMMSQTIGTVRLIQLWLVQSTAGYQYQNISLLISVFLDLGGLTLPPPPSSPPLEPGP